MNNEKIVKHIHWGANNSYRNNYVIVLWSDYTWEGFKKFFDDRAGKCNDGLYPTTSIRQIMWALKMKPLKRERWETCFDRRSI